jgi:hypothetical protein
MGGPGSGRKKGSSGKSKSSAPKAKKYVDPRTKATLKANRAQDRQLKKAGFNPKENPADRRARNSK